MNDYITAEQKETSNAGIKYNLQEDARKIDNFNVATETCESGATRATWEGGVTNA